MAVYEKYIQQIPEDAKYVILTYKTKPCIQLFKQNLDPSKNINSIICPSIRCIDYHSIEERRRPPFDDKTHTLLYNQFPCTSLADETICPDGDKCKMAHSQNEIDFHPLIYKTEPCNDNTTCMMNGSSRLFCPKFHNESEYRNDIKTQPKNDPKKVKNNNNNMTFSTNNINYIVMNHHHQQLQFQYQNLNLGNGNLTSSNKSKKLKVPLDLDAFKIKQCQIKSPHNPKFCLYYHHAGDKRRKVKIVNDNYNYISELCTEIVMNKVSICIHGENCVFSLNKVEQLYHPERYRKKFCSHYPTSITKCEYAEFCSFAHSENEIRIELLHNLRQDDSFNLYKYKTIFCPFITEHDRSQCVYAHNVQDYRRNPAEVDYLPIQCSNWTTNPISSYDEGGCLLMQNCNYCHGWKELDYHPKIYKTKLCANGSECTKKDCAFYHNSNDRVLNPLMSKYPKEKKLKTDSMIGKNNTYNDEKANSSQSDSFTYLKNDLSKNFKNELSNIYQFRDESMSCHTNLNNPNSMNINRLQSIDFKKQNTSHFSRPFMPQFMVGNRSIVNNIDQQDLNKTNHNEARRINEKKSNGPYGDSISSRNNSNYSSDDSFSEAKPNAKRNLELRTNFSERMASPLSTSSDKAHSVGSAQKPLLSTNNQVFMPNNYAYNSDAGSGKGDIASSNKHISKKNINAIPKQIDNLSGLNTQLLIPLTSPSKFEFDSHTSPVLAAKKLESFGQKLIKELKKNGLENCIQIFTMHLNSLDELKDFTPNNYEPYKMLSNEDIQKVMKIIANLKEDEEESKQLFNEINNIGEESHTNDDDNSNKKIYEDFTKIERCIPILGHHHISPIGQKISQVELIIHSANKNKSTFFFNNLN